MTDGTHEDEESTVSGGQNERLVMSDNCCKATDPKMLEKYIMDCRFPKNEKEWWAKNRIEELQELAIWMTGCGYDFTQHEYFCEQRDKLLKT